MVDVRGKSGKRLGCQSFGWISYHGLSGCDVPGNNAARADCDIVADGDPGQQGRASADPDLPADYDRHSDFQALCPFSGVFGVMGAVDLDIGAEHRVVSDPHWGRVQNNATGIEIHPVAQMDVHPVGAVKWGLEKTCLAYTAQQSVQLWRHLSAHVWRAGVVSVNGTSCPCAQGVQFRVQTAIPLS